MNRIVRGPRIYRSALRTILAPALLLLPTACVVDDPAQTSLPTQSIDQLDPQVTTEEETEIESESEPETNDDTESDFVDDTDSADGTTSETDLEAETGEEGDPEPPPAPEPATTYGYKPLNDTGQTFCSDYIWSDEGTAFDVTGSSSSSAPLDCNSVGASVTNDGYDGDGDIVRAGQDAVYGRDVHFPMNSDGAKGFNFTKLDQNGDPLENQGVDFATRPWYCVRDNITGLIWEVKHVPGSAFHADLHSANDIFTLYLEDIGGSPLGYDDYVGARSCVGYDIGDPATYCNTYAYVARVNATGLCGSTSWRMPTAQELLSIAPLDPNFFTKSSGRFLSGTPLPTSERNFVLYQEGLKTGLAWTDQAYGVRLVQDSGR